MFAGLLLTAGIASVVSRNERLIERRRPTSWWLILIGQLGLGIGIQALMPRMNATLALGLFFVFAATMGLTVGVIVSLYTVESVITSFLGASAMFGAAAIYGATTKRNLNSLGGFLFMGMIGAASSRRSSTSGSAAAPFGWAIALIGVVVFTVLHGLRRPEDLVRRLRGVARLGREGVGPRRDPPVHQLRQHLPVPAAPDRRPPLGSRARGLSGRSTTPASSIGSSPPRGTGRAKKKPWPRSQASVRSRAELGRGLDPLGDDADARGRGPGR